MAQLFKTKIGLTAQGYTVYLVGTATEYTLTDDDINNNRSRVAVRVYGIVGAGTATDSTTKVVVNGTTVWNKSATITSSGTTFYSADVTVNHNATTGKATYALEASITMSYLGYSGSSSGVLTLTTIPRASTISSISGGSYLGDTQTVNITRASSSFTHKVEWKFGSYTTYRTEANAADTSCALSISSGSAIYMTDSTSATLTVRVTTFNGSTQVGSAVTKTKKLSLPADVVPSVGTITATRVDNGVPSSWGVYVQGFSKVTVAAPNAAGIYSSTISSYNINGPGIIDAKTSSATSDVIAVSGDLLYSVTVTDSRGRIATDDVSITVQPYSVPSLSVTAQRCNSSGTVTANGTYLLVTATYSCASVAGKNSITSKSVSCNGVSNTTFTSGTAFVLAANCAAGSTYTLTASVTDALGKTNGDPITVTIPTGQRTMNVKANKKGIGFGKFSTLDDYVDSAWNMKVTHSSTDANSILLKTDGSITGNTLTTKGAATIGGTLTVTGTSTLTGKLTAGAVAASSLTVSGTTTLTGKLTAGTVQTGALTASSLTVGSRAYGANNVLWSGTYYLNADQTCTLSQAVSAQPHGIILIWSYYDTSTSASAESNFCTTFIPKAFVTYFSGKFVNAFMSTNTLNIATTKSAYITDTTVTGTSSNQADASTGNTGVKTTPKRFVLRYIIGV